MARADPVHDGRRPGLLEGVGAYAIWGVLPLYLLMLRGVGPDEIVADRIVWSLLLVLVTAAVTGRFTAIGRALAIPRTLALLATSAALVSSNWLIFAWAALNHHVLEASLGYFLSPLCSVLIGVVALRERLVRLQVGGVVLAAAGVALIASAASGQLWISFALAISFSLYGYVRKVVSVEALEGFSIETILLAPVAIAYLLWLAGHGEVRFGEQAGQSVLLAGLGIITAAPLLLFAAAARKLPLSVVGLLQYITPTIQFTLALTVFGEALDGRMLIAFVLIWIGLALFVTGTLRRAPAAT